jgi:hypothetical protein
MTETHAAFIEQAAAVIVVMCEPNTSNGSQSLKQQRSFADGVVTKQLEGLSDDEDDESKAPFVLIRFDSRSNSWTNDEFKNVLYAPALTVTSAKEAAQLLFETEHWPSTRSSTPDRRELLQLLETTTTTPNFAISFL